jgi:hypothetical protein
LGDAELRAVGLLTCFGLLAVGCWADKLPIIAAPKAIAKMLLFFTG